MVQDWITRLRAHALAHYNEDGWDYLVECWSDDEVREVIGKAGTYEAAFRNVSKALKAMGDYRAEIQSTAF